MFCAAVVGEGGALSKLDSWGPCKDSLLIACCTPMVWLMAHACSTVKPTVRWNDVRQALVLPSIHVSLSVAIGTPHTYKLPYFMERVHILYWLCNALTDPN